MSERKQVTLTRHAEVMRVVLDHDTFSSVVSAHRAVPNGMDPPEHTAYRRRIEPFLSPTRAAAFEPVCRALAARYALLVDADREGVARRYAAAAQCAYLGWPEVAVDELVEWLEDKQAAQHAGDRDALARNAAAFEAFVERRMGSASGLSAELAGEFDGPDLASILRNWTVGEIGTIANGIVSLVGFLTAHPELEVSDTAALVEEVLRLHGPLASNRRVATCPVAVGGESLEAGDVVVVSWPDANRDPDAFPAASEYVPDRDQSANLLWGAGIHACPGAPLARTELRVFIDEYLAGRMR